MNAHLKILGITTLTLGTIWILPEGLPFIDLPMLTSAILGFAFALAIIPRNTP